MYKRKLFFFGATTALILFIVLISTAASAHLIRENLQQSSIAQRLLLEHQQISSISYRLFKQLTDEVIFGDTANQAHVRNKQALIKQSMENIRQLEIEQRLALGKQFTQGSVEDTDELESLINNIIDEFQEVLKLNGSAPLSKQDRLRSLLEVTIDNEFRESINTAVARQSSVVAAINARIAAVNSSIVWFAFGLGCIALPLLTYGCYWLFNQLYHPLVVLKNATNAVAAGDYEQPISENLDQEFQELSSAINQLAKRLRQHEFEAEKSRKMLKYEVEQRTSELTRANQQLTTIDVRRKQFLADISHELRTPLTIIRGEAQVTLRLKSPDIDDYKETLTSILEQSVNLTRLVDDLLLLARAEMNQLQLAIIPEPIIPMLEAETSKWQKLYTDRDIRLIDQTGHASISISIDKLRIQQVLSILIDNAVKYSAAGQPVLLTVNQENSWCTIAIHDKGCGISATEIENVFERFVRFSKHNDGLGLGLPIAKAIVEAHDGYIHVDSTQGSGSTFSIRLPVFEGEQQ
ncbi:sensor histidine kinase [Alteromonas sediminis]|uniref:histidine kinase n=1 Tax=Alteromonas sediminis TaxID=2259342 RepID=A0A3N5YEE4_9ALTE|nr:HAMP domain-containing sensor histidine kinase [Alteromonas sediminis]RPJ68085.1 sensor histidine kinase [Alteromonas sediminis]